MARDQRGGVDLRSKVRQEWRLVVTILALGSLILLPTSYGSLGLGTGHAGFPTDRVTGDAGAPSLSTVAEASNATATDPSTVGRALSANAPNRIAYTLEPQNGTLLQGRHAAFSPGTPLDAVYDAKSRQVLVGDSTGDHVYAYNASTGSLMNAVPDYPGGSGSDPYGLAIDPVHDNLWVANLGAGVAVMNLTSDTFVKQIPLNDSPEGITYDSQNGFVYAVGFSSGNITVFNSTTQDIVRTKQVVGAHTITYDPLSQSLYLAGGFGAVLVVNASNLQVVGRIAPRGTDPQTVLYDPLSRSMVVSNYVDNLTFINATSNQLSGAIPPVFVRGFLGNLAFNPTTGEIYVAGAGHTDGAGVGVVGARNGSYLREINTAGSTPNAVVYVPEGNVLFAFSEYHSELTLVNGVNDTVVDFSIPLQTSYIGATYDSGNGQLYLATWNASGSCADPGRLTIVDPTTRPSLTGTVPAGKGPEQTAVDPVRHRVFTTNLCSNSVTVANDTTDQSVGAPVAVGGGPVGIVVNPQSGLVYVADVYDGSIWVINESTLMTTNLTTIVNAAPDAFAYDPGNQRIFISDYGSGTVSILNTSSQTVLPNAVPVGANPQGILYDSGNGLVYVACGGSANVTVIDASTLKSIGSITTEYGPTALALDPAAGVLYVANYNNGTVDLINTVNNTRIGGFVRVLTGPQGIAYIPRSNQVDVTDSNYGTVSILANAPQITSLNASPNPTEPGVRTIVNSSVANGTAPLTASWSGVPPGCLQTGPLVLACDFLRGGTFRVYLNVTDSQNYSAWGALGLTVAGTSTSSAFLRVAPSVVDLGGNVSLNLSALGGVAPYSYTYFGLPIGCHSANSSSISCTPNSTGDYGVTGLATDSLGREAQAQANVTVNPRPWIAAFLANPSVVFPNQTVSFSVYTTGGTSPLTIAYSGLPSGCASADTPSLSCDPSRPGNSTVGVTAVDALGAMTTASVSVVVTSFPRLAVNLSVFPSEISLGQAVVFVSDLSGEVGTVSWISTGLPPGCPPPAAAVFSCSPSLAGTYSVTIWAKDGLGRQSSASAGLKVLPNSSGQRPSSGFAAWELLAAGLVGGALAFGLALFVVTRPPRSKIPYADQKDVRMGPQQ